MNMNTCHLPPPPVTAMLPLADDIPGDVVLRPDSTFWSNIALWCDDAGLVKAEDWQKARVAQDIAISALTRWSAALQDMKLLGTVMSFEEADDQFFEHLECYVDFKEIAQARGLNADAPHVAVTSYPIQFADRVIGPKVLAVEAAVPGLGETALAAIRCAADRSVNVFDPWYAMFLASVTYWYGEDNEELAMEEIALSGEDPDDYGLVKLKDFHDLAPAWAWSPQRKLDPAMLEQIVQDARQAEETRQIAALCSKIFRHTETHPIPDAQLGLHDLTFYGVGMALWWDYEPGCVMQRVWDDYYYQIMQGGEGNESFGIDLFEATPEGFKGWLEGKRNWLILASLEDRLIDLISEEVKRQ